MSRRPEVLLEPQQASLSAIGKAGAPAPALPVSVTGFSSSRVARASPLRLPRDEIVKHSGVPGFIVVVVQAHDIAVAAGLRKSSEYCPEWGVREKSAVVPQRPNGFGCPGTAEPAVERTRTGPIPASRPDVGGSEHRVAADRSVTGRADVIFEFVGLWV